MKTQVKLLDSAKQGNLDALVALINQPLEHRQIIASASLNRRCLTITAEAPAEPPGRLFFVDFVKQGINTLKPRGVERVIVQGKRKQESAIAWHDQFKVEGPNLDHSDLSLGEPTSSRTPASAFPSSSPAQSASTSSSRLEPLPSNTEPSDTGSSEIRPSSARSYAESPVSDGARRRRLPVTPSTNVSPRPQQTSASTPVYSGSQRRLMNHAFSFLWASSFLLGCLLTVSVVSWFMPQRIARTEWEYRIVSIEDNDFNLAIQQLGDEGWELAYARRAIAEEGDLEYSLYELILKRPKSLLD